MSSSTPSAAPLSARPVVATGLSESARALAEIVRELTRMSDPDRLFALVARHAMTLVGARAGRVALRDGDGFVVRGACGDGVPGVGSSLPLDGTIGGEAIARGLPVRTADVHRAGRWPASAEVVGLEMTNAIAVPLVVGGDAAGVIVAFGNPTRPFDEGDEALLLALADYAAIGAENARLIERERRQRIDADAASSIARLALATSDVHEMAEAILETLDVVLPSDGKALAIVDRDGATLEYVAGTGVSRGLVGARLAIADSLGREGMRTHEPVHVSRPVEVAHPSVRDRMSGSDVVLVPLVAQERAIGLLAMTTSRGRLPAADLDRLRRLADSIALAVDVRLLEEEERRRRQRERSLAVALATLDQPVLVVGLDDRIVYANAAAAREFGHEERALVGMPLEALAADEAARQAAAGAPAEGDCRQRRADGTEFPAVLVTSVLTDERGAPAGRVVALRNVAEERRLAEQLRQTEKLVALGELVAGVAHEVNNPLTGISAFAELLLEEGLSSEEQTESVRLIKKEAARAGRVIRDLLVFARKSGPRHGPVDLNAVVEQALRLRAYGLRASGIEVEAELDHELPLIDGDDAKLQQVVLNLVVNAEHALQKSPSRRLRLRTCRRAESIVLEVADTGEGMVPEVRRRIFEPFFTTKPEGAGTGLGLSVSYGIVQAHGGDLSVESVPGAGTTFHVVLPLRRQPPLAPAPSPASDS